MKRQRKKWKFWLVPLVIFLLFAGPVLQSSASNSQKVVDMAGILDAGEEEKLQKQLEKIAEKYTCDVVVVTTDSCEGKQIREYTDDYYEAQNYGYGANYSGILLMVSMGDRKYHMTTQGWAISVFWNSRLQAIDETISTLLADGKYYKAFRKFGDLAEEYMEEAKYGTTRSKKFKFESSMDLDLRISISLLAGVIVAACVYLGLFAQLKSVRGSHTAQDYVQKGSFHVTRQKDVFLYSTVSKTKIEKIEETDETGGGGTHTTSGGGKSTTHTTARSGSSTTHTTSSGRRAGGHTGSF